MNIPGSKVTNAVNMYLTYGTFKKVFKQLGFNYPACTYCLADPTDWWRVATSGRAL